MDTDKTIPTELNDPVPTIPDVVSTPQDPTSDIDSKETLSTASRIRIEPTGGPPRVLSGASPNDRTIEVGLHPRGDTYDRSGNRGTGGYRARGRGRGRGRGGGAFNGSRSDARHDPQTVGVDFERNQEPYEKHPLSSHLPRPYFQTQRPWWPQWQEWDTLFYPERIRLRKEWLKEQAILKERPPASQGDQPSVAPQSGLDEDPAAGAPFRPRRIPLEIYQPHRNPLPDRLHFAATDFRSNRPNPKYADPEGGEEKVLLGWIWDQLRLYAGLLGSTPVWNWVEPGVTPAKKEPSASTSTPTQEWADISDDEEGATQQYDQGAYGKYPAKPPLPRRPYALVDYIPHTITNQSQLDAVRALSRFQKFHRLFRFMVDLEKSLKIFLSSYIYEMDMSEAWSVVGYGKIGRVVKCWLRFLLEGAGQTPAELEAEIGDQEGDVTTIIMNEERIQVPAIPPELEDLTALESVGSARLVPIFNQLVGEARASLNGVAESATPDQPPSIPVAFREAVRRGMEVADSSVIELAVAHGCGKVFPGDLGGWCGEQWGLSPWNTKPYEALVTEEEEESGSFVDKKEVKVDGGEKRGTPAVRDNILATSQSQEGSSTDSLVIFGPVPPPNFATDKNNVTMKVVANNDDPDLPHVADLVSSSVADIPKHKAQVEFTSAGDLSASDAPNQDTAQSWSFCDEDNLEDWLPAPYIIPAEVADAFSQVGCDVVKMTQKNVRRIKKVIPSSPYSEANQAESPLRTLLESKYAKVVLAPWVDWHYKFGRDAESLGKLCLNGNEVAELDECDPRTDDITVLIENEVLKNTGLIEGMGLVGTWGRLEVNVGNVNEGTQHFWYVEKLDMAVPSYWVNNDRVEEDV